MTTSPTGLIGGIGMTEVHVYAQRMAPDGTWCGCPHVHAVSDEGYFVLQGTGSVEFHDLVNGYRKLPLAPGHYVHIPPLIMHRLISNGHLVILGIMANAGLVERGEARVYFGPEIDEDIASYREQMSLPATSGLEGALGRRDLAIVAYQRLMRLWHTDRNSYFTELRRFFSHTAATLAPQSDEFSVQVKNGPAAWAEATASRVARLPAMPDAPADVFYNSRGMATTFGMCGVLRPIASLEKMRGPGV